MVKLRGGVGLVAILVAGACAPATPVPTPQRPNTTVDDPHPKFPTNNATETATIHLWCESSDERQHPSYTLDLVANHVDTCRIGNAVTVIFESSANPGSQMQFTIENYAAAGSYRPASFAISSGNLLADGCADGTINVLDVVPGQGFPKRMGFVIDCPNLHNSTTHACGALKLDLRMDCTQ